MPEQCTVQSTQIYCTTINNCKSKKKQNHSLGGNFTKQHICYAVYCWALSLFTSAQCALVTFLIWITYIHTLCPEKRDQNAFGVSPVGRNLVYRYLNNFAAKFYKRFPSHLNNVSTLPCKTWNALYGNQPIQISLENAAIMVVRVPRDEGLPCRGGGAYGLWGSCRFRFLGIQRGGDY